VPQNCWFNLILISLLITYAIILVNRIFLALFTNAKHLFHHWLLLIIKQNYSSKIFHFWRERNNTLLNKRDIQYRIWPQQKWASCRSWVRKKKRRPCPHSWEVRTSSTGLHSSPHLRNTAAIVGQPTRYPSCQTTHQ